MADRDHIVAAIRASGNFQSEVRYIARGGYVVADSPRLFKHLENGLVRVVFPTTATEMNDGTVVAMVCLWDSNEGYNIYAHTICAGGGVNILLRTMDHPMPQALPQPLPEGPRAIRKFVAWKEASWVKFLNDELAVGNARASRLWIACFWKALDRMFGGGNLLGFDPEAEIRAAEG